MAKHIVPLYYRIGEDSEVYVDGDGALCVPDGEGFAAWFGPLPETFAEECLDAMAEADALDNGRDPEELW